MISPVTFALVTCKKEIEGSCLLITSLIFSRYVAYMPADMQRMLCANGGPRCGPIEVAEQKDCCMAQGSDFGSNLVTRNVTPVSLTPAESNRSSLDGTPDAVTPPGARTAPADHHADQHRRGNVAQTLSLEDW